MRERHGNMKVNEQFRRGKGPLGYLVAAFLVIAALPLQAADRATWTGSAGNGLFLDPGNWTCFNGADEQIVGGVPAADAAITLAADVPANGWADANFAEMSGPIDLAGHSLTVPGAFFNVTLPALTDGVTPGSRKVLTTCGGFEGAAVTLAADAPDWAKGRLTVNADGNIALDVQPKGTVIAIR